MRPRELLQAWDSADELLLVELSRADLIGKRIAIINDHFGALTLSLNSFDVTSYTDSFVSAKALACNRDLNQAVEDQGGSTTGRDLNANSLIHDLDQWSGVYDFVVIQLPKSNSFLEEILSSLTPHLRSSSKIICGGMIKYISKTSFELLEKYIGPTTTNLAQKKARLIFASFEKGPAALPEKVTLSVPPFDQPLVNASNLFSHGKLDIGTRFFLEHIPSGNFETILDLGCANGIIGMMAKRINPQAKLIFCDESYQAVQSARLNYEGAYSDEAQFVCTNCYENGISDSLDLVLCNPPFHQHNTVGDFIALQMFHDSFRTLKKGGVLRVIGNSHLGYALTLKRIFGNSTMVASNQKFVIFDAVKLF